MSRSAVAYWKNLRLARIPHDTTPNPTITSVQPISGANAGGQPIIITGTNFTSVAPRPDADPYGPSGQSFVENIWFGLVPCTAFTVDGATQITATSPASAVGPVYVVVNTGGGCSVAPTAFTFTFVPVIHGALAMTLGAMSGTETGTVKVQGTLAQTLGAMTLAATGIAPAIGTLAQTLGAMTLAATGIAPATGTLAQTLGAMTVVATGTVTTTFVITNLELSGFWQGGLYGLYASNHYQWEDTASAGLSGGRVLDKSGAGTFPAVVTLNGHDCADFQGSPQELFTDIDPTEALTWTDYFEAVSGIGSGWVLLKVDTEDTDATTAYNNRTCFSTVTGAAAQGLHFRSSQGARMSAYDSGYKFAYKALGTGSIALVTFSFDGTYLKIGVNEAPGASGGASVVACGAVTDVTGVIRFGQDYFGGAGNFFDGQVYDAGFSKTVISDANFDNIKAYCNTRYGLSL